MTIVTKLIPNTDVVEQRRLLNLIELLSVFERGGTIQNLVRGELNRFSNKAAYRTDFHIVAAYNNEALIGYAFYTPSNKLTEYYVLPHWRSLGVGAKLVEGIRTWSKDSALTGYCGFGHWREFYTRNFIICLDDYETVSREDVKKYGCEIRAYKTILANAKRSMSRALKKAA